MNKKEKNIELKIYELLGIKTFKKMLFKLVYICLIPFTLGITKEERHKIVYNTPSNYSMKKGHEIQDIRDFKKKLLFNTIIHILALIASIPSFLAVISNTASLSTTIITLFLIPMNIYCIMLQRYNHIRINQIIKKRKPYEEAKKSKLKEELKKEDALLNKHTYKIVNKRDKEKDITFERLLENATYEQLKQYRNYLIHIKEINSITEEQLSIPLSKKKTLKLEFKQPNIKK